MQKAQDTEAIGIVCIRCGHVNHDRASRCEKCNSPLDDFASTSPWEMGTSTSSAYSPPSNPRTKPIIFWGVWLYFGPSAVGSLWYIGSYIIYLISDNTSTYGSHPEIATGGVMILILCLMYGVLSVWALWSVSKGYLRKQNKAEQSASLDG